MATAGLPGTSEGPFPPTYGNAVNPFDVFGDEEPEIYLPAYTGSSQPAAPPRQVSRQEKHEFDYAIDKRGKSFLLMTLITSGSQTRPIFLGGYPVEGKIRLNLEHPDSIKSLILTIKGLLITGATGYDGFTSVFLEKKHTIWSQEEQKAALQPGDHTWPFSVELPEEVSVVVNRQPTMFRLPQTFNQAFVHSTIRYEISVKVSRKSFIKPDDKLVVPFWYIPVIRPPPLPPLRRFAYEENNPIAGPKVDPDGWFLPKSVQIEGRAFNDRTARVECKLFLAKPLSYTRGSAIPLFIILESDDQQVLDMLSSPSAISVRVRRRTRWTTVPHKPLESSVWRDEVDHSQRAVWWPATEYSDGNFTDRVRRLNGELHLKPDMAPTSAMSVFAINYSVVLLQFNTPAFQVAEGPLILEQPITVVTAFAAGPRPKSKTAPDYTPDITRKAEEMQLEVEYSRGFY